jgi:hypothetical protein
MEFEGSIGLGTGKMKKINRKFRVPRKQGAHFLGAGLKFNTHGKNQEYHPWM